MVTVANEKNEKTKHRTHKADIPWKTDDDQVQMIKLSKDPDKKKSEITGRKEEK